MERTSDEYVACLSAAGPGVLGFSVAAWASDMSFEVAWPFVPFVVFLCAAPGFPLVGLALVRWLPHPQDQLRRPSQWWRLLLVAAASVWHLALFDVCSYLYDGSRYVDWSSLPLPLLGLSAATTACWTRYRCNSEPDSK